MFERVSRLLTRSVNAALIVMSLSGLADAKVISHVIDDHGLVQTIDTDTDTVVAKRALTNLQAFVGETGHVVASASDNLLFVVDGRRWEFRVKVFELKSLTFKRDLGVLSSTSPEVLIPPKTPHFFVRSTDFAGRQTIARYEKSSLARLGDPFTVTALGDRNFA